MESSEKFENIPLFTTRARTQPVFEDKAYQEVFKRFFDLTLAILILPITLPILLVLMVLIKISSRGPAVFKSERIGIGGSRFQCLKLRTMCVHAEEKLQVVLRKNPTLRAEWEKDHKLKKDPRITKVGRVIRALSLDEIPQIFNVIKGEMSFVGPRPIVEAEISKYGKSYKYYTRVKPGITGIWQINGRNDTTYENRVAMDKHYSQSLNFLTDLKIIIKTVPAALSKKGAY